MNHAINSNITYTATSAQILEWDYETYGLSSSGLYATNITCSDYVNYTSSLDDYCNYTESTVCNGTHLVVQCVYGKFINNIYKVILFCYYSRMFLW